MHLRLVGQRRSDCRMLRGTRCAALCAMLRFQSGANHSDLGQTRRTPLRRSVQCLDHFAHTLQGPRRVVRSLVISRVCVYVMPTLRVPIGYIRPLKTPILLRQPPPLSGKRDLAARGIALLEVLPVNRRAVSQRVAGDHDQPLRVRPQQRHETLGIVREPPLCG